MFKKIIPLLLIFIVPIVLKAQYIDIRYVEGYNYPEMIAEFEVYDENGDKMRDFNPMTDLVITENGIKRNITYANCPENLAKFSLILTMDKSASMLDPINASDLTKRSLVSENTARYCIDALPENRSECALLLFSAGKITVNGSGMPTFFNPELLHDYSNDKGSLKNSLNKISYVGGTNYVWAFLGYDDERFGHQEGVVDLAKRSKYKPICVFITDGEHNSGTSSVKLDPPAKQAIEDACIENNISVYVITLGVDVNSLSDSYNFLENLTQKTGGKCYPRVLSEEELRNTYAEILSSINPDEYPAPCEVRWEGDCKTGGDAIFEITYEGNKTAKGRELYSFKDGELPELRFISTTRQFYNVPPAGSDTRTITFAAEHKDIIIDSYTSNNPRFEVEGLPLTIKEGETKSLTVRYNPTDSVCQEASMTLEGNVCLGNTFGAVGGFVFTEECDFGNIPMGGPVEQTFVAKFKNHTCVWQVIDKAEIISDPDNRFEYLGEDLVVGDTIWPGEEIDLKFRYKATKAGRFEADFKVKTNAINFTSKVKARTLEKGNLISDETLDFGITNCSNPNKQMGIDITNTGQVDLEIEKIEITGASAAEFVYAGPQTVTFVAEDKTTLIIDFVPDTQKPGLKAAELLLYEAGVEDPVYAVNLKGEYQNTDLVVNLPMNEEDEYVIDFGTICPLQDYDTTFVIQNMGSAIADVELETSNLTLDQTVFDLPNGNKEIRVTVNIGFEGSFSQIITVLENLCSDTDLIKVQAVAEFPKIKTDSYNFSASLGATDTKDIVIENTSNRDIILSSKDDLIPSDNQFIVNSVSSLTIPAKGQITANITYQPDQPSDVNAYLQVLGQPCDFNDSKSIELIASPKLGFVEVFIADDYKAPFGAVETIDIVLHEKSNFAPFDISKVSFTLTYDPIVLQNSTLDPSATGNIDFIDLAVNSDDEDQIIVSLDFDVIGNPDDISDLIITDVEFDKEITHNEENGLFTVQKSTAGVKAEGKDVLINDKFTIPFFITDYENIVPEVHKSIILTIKYDASMLFPIGNMPKGTVDDEGMRTIEYKISLDDEKWSDPNGEDILLTDLEFQALLGKSDEVTLNCTLVTEFGSVDFYSIAIPIFVNGQKETDGVKRLFDPFAKLEVGKIMPNPASDQVKIEFSTAEEGEVKIWILDLFGNKIKLLASEKLKAKKHERTFSLDDISSGAYLIMIETKNQSVNEQINIIK